MSFFLGVDGGQTTTKGVLADEQGRILARASAGPSNHTEEPGGKERLINAVSSLVSDLQSRDAVKPTGEVEFAAACFGMSGECAIKRRILEGIIPTRRVSVVHDSVNALAGATAGAPGVVVVAGTGSVARGVDPKGREMTAGGWGHLFGDEGSAYWIGREAARAAAVEGASCGRPTRITSMFFERLGISSAQELMAKYYSAEWPREHLAGLARWVDEAGENGDEVARAILTSAGNHLALLAATVISYLFPQPAAPAVSYTGGVFKSRFVLCAFKRAVLDRCPTVVVQPPILSPVLGSLLLAYRSAGIEMSRDTLKSWVSAGQAG
jgi:N-acetylglucosamine kinase-like BadF-type ATPase